MGGTGEALGGATICSPTLHCESPPRACSHPGLCLGTLGCLLARPVPASRYHTGISLSFLKSRGGWDEEVSQRGSQLKKASPHFSRAKQGLGSTKRGGSARALGRLQVGLAPAADLHPWLMLPDLEQHRPWVAQSGTIPWRTHRHGTTMEPAEVL